MNSPHTLVIYEWMKQRQVALLGPLVKVICRDLSANQKIVFIVVG